MLNYMKNSARKKAKKGKKMIGNDSKSNSKKTIIVIPARNEEKRIGRVIEEVIASSGNEVIVVDNNSNDRTAREARKAGAEVVFASKKGKGRAVRVGCDYAYQKGAQKIILLDGDGQHPPTMIPVIEKALDYKDIIFGLREQKHKLPLRKRLGGIIIDFAYLFLFKITIKDIICGYKGFTRESYRKIRWCSDNYDLETEIVLRAKQKRIRYAQILIPLIDVKKKEQFSIIHGIGTLKQMLIWYFFGLKKPNT